MSRAMTTAAVSLLTALGLLLPMGRAHANYGALSASLIEISALSSKGSSEGSSRDSSNSSSDSSSNSSDSGGKRPKKLIIPLQSRGEAARWLARGGTDAVSPLLRSILDTLRQHTQDRGQSPPSDRELAMYLIGK